MILIVKILELVAQKNELPESAGRRADDGHLRGQAPVVPAPRHHHVSCHWEAVSHQQNTCTQHRSNYVERTGSISGLKKARQQS